MSMRMRFLMETLCIAVLVFLGAAGRSALAQCNPPAAGTKCWTGEGFTDDWSIAANWNPFGKPEIGEPVFHLIGGPINLDIGTAQNPVQIADFRFGPTPGSMTIEPGKVMIIDEAFAPNVFEPAGTYNLTVQDGALLRVGTRMENVDVVVESGTSELTRLDLSLATFANGSCELQPQTRLFARAIDLQPGAAGNPIWNVQGGLQPDALTGYGEIRVASPPNGFAYMQIGFDCEASKLDLKGTEVDTGFEATDNVLRIREQLRIEDSYLIHSYGRFVAEPGSSIELLGSALLVAPAYGGVGQPTYVDNIAYGLPSSSGNAFWNGVGLVFTEASSTLRGIESSGNQLELFVLNGDLEIHSRIHEEASQWDADGVSLTLHNFGTHAPTEKIEATSPDFGGIWFLDSPCIKHWGEVEFLAGDLIQIVDEWENSRSSVSADTGLPEAIYVGHVVVQNGADVGLNDLQLYYDTKTGDPCPGPSPADPSDCFTHATITTYGDYDGDEVADDAGDAARFLAAYPCMDANEEYDALADWDCDGVISYVEHQKFLSNWPGATGLGDECTDHGPCLDRDVCLFGCCLEGGNVCSFQSAAYGDVLGTQDVCGRQGEWMCGPDGVVDVFDILAVLNAFGGAFPEDCAVHNFDLAPCNTDGVIDIFDVLAVLDAFSGIDACCGGGAKVFLAASDANGSPEVELVEAAAGNGATRVSVTTGVKSAKAKAESGVFIPPSVHGAKVVASETQLTLVPQDNSIDAGDTVTVDVFADDVKDLRGYQLRLTGTDAGFATSATIVDVYVDTERDDYVFFGADARHAEDMENHRMVVALMKGGVTQTGRVYFGTFVFKADESAEGAIRTAIYPVDGMILVDPTGAVLDVAAPSGADVIVE
ncbi:MAG: hypothetical protein HOP29_03080 [Phycisphaerales bacterium]|nr:hypothetical protein [Phycisphaerales bacterium]